MPHDPFKHIPKGNIKHDSMSIVLAMMEEIMGASVIPKDFFINNTQPISSTKGKSKVMWKARGTEEICITEMSTRHLFFTLRLVYNNLIPLQELQLDFDAR